MRAWLPCVLAAAVIACGDAVPSMAGSPFVPTAADFTDFRTWPRVSLGDVSAGGHPEGPTQYAYVNHPRPAGSRMFDPGTVIVRTLESGPPATWEIFAMAKRGHGYNPDGDVGWEFFRLGITDTGAVTVLARGLAPMLSTDDTYTLGDGVGCNTCHGSADARAYDGVLSPALRPPDL